MNVRFLLHPSCVGIHISGQADVAIGRLPLPGVAKR